MSPADSAAFVAPLPLPIAPPRRAQARRPRVVAAADGGPRPPPRAKPSARRFPAGLFGRRAEADDDAEAKAAAEGREWAGGRDAGESGRATGMEGELREGAGESDGRLDRGNAPDVPVEEAAVVAARSWFPGWAPKERVGEDGAKIGGEPDGEGTENGQVVRRAVDELARANKEKVAAAEKEYLERQEALREKNAGGFRNALGGFFGGKPNDEAGRAGRAGPPGMPERANVARGSPDAEPQTGAETKEAVNFSKRGEPARGEKKPPFFGWPGGSKQSDAQSGPKRAPTPPPPPSPKKPSGGDLWTKIVDVIVPNREPNPDQVIRRHQAKAPTVAKRAKQPSEREDYDGLPRSSLEDDETADEATEANGEDEAEAARRGTGVQELYRPPSGGAKGKGGRQGGWLSGVLSKIPGFESEGHGKASATAADKNQAQGTGGAVGTDLLSTDGSGEEGVGLDLGDSGADGIDSGRETDSVAMNGKKVSVAGEGLADDLAGKTNRVDGDEKKVLVGSSAPSKSGSSTSRLPSPPPSPPVEMSSVPQSDVAAIRNIFGSETFFATETLSPPGGLIFRGNLRGEPKAVLAKLEERLHKNLGDKYTLCLAEGEEDLRPVVVVVPTARDKRPASPRQQLFCIMITSFTISTCYARALYANWQTQEFRAFFSGTAEKALNASAGGAAGRALTRVLLRFPVTSVAVAIAFVVLLSQVVQRWMARRHNTRIGLPFLIPSYQLGSFGSIVQVASPTPTRAALFDIALAGAATLFFSSVILLLIGLRLSTPAGALMIPVPMSMLSSSWTIGWLTRMLAGGGQLSVHTASSLVGLHPVAVVGANCLTIAALNLLPIRQLDGGRIVSAIYGRKTAVLASRVTIFFLLLASSKSNYLFVFLALIMFGPWSLDRPSKNELTEPNNARALIGYAFLLLMLAVLLPYPSHLPFKL